MTPEERFVVENVPEVLLRTGPRGLAYWQWLALPVLILVAWLVGAVVGRVLRSIALRIVKRTDATWDDVLVERIAGPLTLAASAGVAFLLHPWLRLQPDADRLLGRTVKTVAFIAFFWLLLRVVDIVGTVLLRSSPWAAVNPAARSLVMLGNRIAKVAIGAIGVVAVLSSLGYPVASLVAGLGIGGLAVALAAQKTFENLFGAFAVGVDQPFREGDFVKIDDLQGTIETIGLRSTRIRTLDRTLVTIPNGQIAEKRIESFAVRDRFRFYVTVGIQLSATSAQTRQALADVLAALLEAPKVVAEDAFARPIGIGESALAVEIGATFRISDANEFAALKGELVLKILELVEQSGAALAYPTRTVRMESRP